MNHLTPHFEHACALAAMACQPWVGKGDKEAADAAAVEAMRGRFAQAPMAGRIVIGEGERDEAPMLFIGEQVGAGGPAVDIAVDPLEGTRFNFEKSDREIESCCCGTRRFVCSTFAC